MELISLWIFHGLSISVKLDPFVPTKLEVIQRYKSILSDESIQTPFISCIRPVMEYACHLFAGSPKSHITLLQQIEIEQFVQQPLATGKLKPHT